MCVCEFLHVLHPTTIKPNHCTCNVTVTCDSMPILVVCLCATVVYVCTQSGSCALALLLSSLRQKRLDGNDALMLLLLYIQVYSTHVPLFTPYHFTHFRFSYILRYTCAKFQMFFFQSFSSKMNFICTQCIVNLIHYIALPDTVHSLVETMFE